MWLRAELVSPAASVQRLAMSVSDFDNFSGAVSQEDFESFSARAAYSWPQETPTLQCGELPMRLRAELVSPAASFQRLALTVRGFGSFSGAVHQSDFETLTPLIRIQLAAGGPNSPVIGIWGVNPRRRKRRTAAPGRPGNRGPRRPGSAGIRLPESRGVRGLETDPTAGLPSAHAIGARRFRPVRG